MNSSWEPWNHVAHICPSLCQTVRKRSHIRASRHSAQFSISSRIAMRSAAALGIDGPSSHGRLVPATHLFMVIILQDMDVRDKRGHNERSAEFGVMPRLAGKTAIVTGGAKGIGRHYSQALAAEGARVM